MVARGPLRTSGIPKVTPLGPPRVARVGNAATAEGACFAEMDTATNVFRFNNTPVAQYFLAVQYFSVAVQGFTPFCVLRGKTEI